MRMLMLLLTIRLQHGDDADKYVNTITRYHNNLKAAKVDLPDILIKVLTSMLRVLPPEDATCPLASCKRHRRVIVKSDRKLSALRAQPIRSQDFFTMTITSDDIRSVKALLRTGSMS